MTNVTRTLLVALFLLAPPAIAGIAPAGSVLLEESCFPTNHAVDPRETVSLDLALRNDGDAATSNLVATLQPGSGIASPSGPQVYGAIAPGATRSRSFTFTATGSCGGPATATLALTDEGRSLGSVSFPIALGLYQNSVTLANPQPIDLSAEVGPGLPYPSTIEVSGFSDPVTRVRVTLSGLTHSAVSDLNVLLVGPQGQSAMLLSDVSGRASGATLAFEDGAPRLPQGNASATIGSGTYGPTDYTPILHADSDLLAPPAPPGPYTNELAVFNGVDPNGTWSLYVQDDLPIDGGALSGGWTLSLESSRLECCTAVPGLIELESSSYSAGETANSVTLTVVRSDDAQGAASVDYATADGSAQSGADYVPASGRVEFADGETAKSITVSIEDDLVGEDVESLSLSLSNPSGVAVLGERREATVTIFDNDPAGPAVTRGPYLNKATPTSVVVRWRTNVPLPSHVRYGTSPGSLTASAGSLLPTVEHEVVLSGLTPATRYAYAVGTPETILSGGEDHFFVTAPAAGAVTPVRIWAFGDSGFVDQDQRAVRDQYLKWTAGRGTDVWLLLGDNAYIVATDLDYQNAFFNSYRNVMRNTVFWSTFGNHEGFSAVSAAQSGEYYQIFSFPTAAEAGGVGSGTEAYYSFDHGNVHFVSLNTHDVDRSPSGAMANWLRADLAANRRDWTIAFFHHPPYSRGSHNSDGETAPDSALSIRETRQNLLPILEEGGVDLVLAAHSHSYERSMLLDGHYGLSSTLTEAMKKNAGDGRPAGDGPYFKTDDVTADAQAGTVYAVVGTGSEATGGALDHPVMKKSLRVPGSLVVDVSGKRLDAKFLDRSGSVGDDFTIVKGVRLRLSQAAYEVSELRESALLTVERIGDPTGRIQVNFTTSDGTATAGSDYVAASGTVVLESGETSKSFSVALGDDSLDEADETFRVVLSDPSSGVGLAEPLAAVVTILDDDVPGAGVVQFESAAAEKSEPALEVVLSVTRTGGSNGPVTVRYATASGTATSGSDFVAATGVLTWAAGDTMSKKIRVALVDDTLAEPDETFDVVLSNATGGATVGTPAKVTVLLHSEDAK